jgi:hypothetical protein
MRAANAGLADWQESGGRGGTELTKARVTQSITLAARRRAATELR